MHPLRGWGFRIGIPSTRMDSLRELLLKGNFRNNFRFQSGFNQPSINKIHVLFSNYRISGGNPLFNSEIMHPLRGWVFHISHYYTDNKNGFPPGINSVEIFQR